MRTFVLGCARAALLSAAALLPFGAAAQAPSGAEKAIVEIGPAPEGVPLSADYRVEVNGRPVPVWAAKVVDQFVKPRYKPRPHVLPTESVSLATFAMSDKVSVRITPQREVEDVVVRPLSAGIAPRTAGRDILFDLAAPRFLSVELNGSTRRALHVFACPVETEPPRENAKNVRYFGPGLHEAGKISVAGGETVYLAGGAVVRGAITSTGQRDIRICGRGVLDGSRREGGPMISLERCSQARIEDITILDAPVWTVVLRDCEDVKISGLKLVSWRQNSDGIDVCSSRKVNITDCFIRGYDDSVVIKGIPTGDNRPEVADIAVSRCVLWNDWATGLKIGTETKAPRFRDILFRDIDLLHNWHGAAMAIKSVDAGVISGVRFEDIRVEDHRTELLRLTISGPDGRDRDPERGQIQGVVFKGISVADGPLPPSLIQGFDPAHRVEDVVIEDVKVRGKSLESVRERWKFTVGEHTKNIVIR